MDVRTAGVLALAVLLAGCTQSLPGPGQDGVSGDDPETLVKQYYDLASQLKGAEDVQDKIDEEFIQSIEDITHSKSPIPKFIESFANSTQGEFEITAPSNAEFETVGEDLTADEIRNRTEIAWLVEEDVIEKVAGDNRLVEVTYPEGQEPDNILVVRENGEWVILM